MPSSPDSVADTSTDDGNSTDPIEQLMDCCKNLDDVESRSAAAAEMSRVLDLLHAAPTQLTQIDAKMAAQDRHNKALAALVQCDAIGAILRVVEGSSAPQEEVTRSHLLHVVDKVRRRRAV